MKETPDGPEKAGFKLGTAGSFRIANLPYHHSRWRVLSTQPVNDHRRQDQGQAESHGISLLRREAHGPCDWTELEADIVVSVTGYDNMHYGQ